MVSHNRNLDYTEYTNLVADGCVSGNPSKSSKTICSAQKSIEKAADPLNFTVLCGLAFGRGASNFFAKKASNSVVFDLEICLLTRRASLETQKIQS